MDDKKIQSKLRGNPEIAAVWSGVSLECKGMIPNCAEHYCLETSPKRSKIVSVIKKIALTSEIIRHPILTSLHDVARTQYIYECCFKAGLRCKGVHETLMRCILVYGGLCVVNMC